MFAAVNKLYSDSKCTNEQPPLSKYKVPEYNMNMNIKWKKEYKKKKAKQREAERGVQSTRLRQADGESKRKISRHQKTQKVETW